MYNGWVKPYDEHDFWMYKSQSITVKYNESNSMWEVRTEESCIHQAHSRKEAIKLAKEYMYKYE